MADHPTPLFEFRSVSLVAPDGRARLRSVDGSIPDRGVTVIVGPSGSGKSSLLRLCNRLEAPTSGDVRFRGVPLTALDPLLLRGQAAMLFQRPVTFAGTVRDNLLVAEPDGNDERFAHLLSRSGLDPEFLDRVADDLSGGERQRVCLARALANRPSVLLADEPTSALDPEATTWIESLARRMADEGVPVVWVTQDLEQIDRLADHVLVVVDGAVAHSGPAARIRADAPEPARSFLS